MSRADRSFALVIAAVLVFGLWLATPLFVTFFPGLAARLVRGSTDALQFCNGVVASVHAELPPFGAIVLVLAGAIALAAFARLQGVLVSVRNTAGCASIMTPPRLARAAARTRVTVLVTCVDHPAAFAYCRGLLHPRIYVSRGAVLRLRALELEAVLLHETHHLRRRDPLRTLAVRTFAIALRVTPIVAELAARFEVAKELDADRSVLQAQGTPRALAGALFVLGESLAPSVGPASSAWSLATVRIDQLSGARERALSPAPSRRSVVLTGLTLLIALVLLLGQAARAHLLMVEFLPEPAGALAHACTLPIRGPLL